jgi:hypothetical protein
MWSKMPEWFLMKKAPNQTRRFEIAAPPELRAKPKTPYPTTERRLI